MNVKYLTGPISLDYYINSTTGDQIYIFGDHHIIKPQCPCDDGVKTDITSFIVDFALSREIDLFIEEPINASGSLLTKLHGESYIDAILKREGATPNLRMYKIDWRQSTSTEAPYNYYLCLTIYHTLDLIFSNKPPEFQPAFTDKYYTFLSILKNTQAEEWLACASNVRDRWVLRNYFINQYFSRFVPPSEYKRTVGKLRSLYLTHHQSKITFTYKDGRIEGFQTVGTRACLFLKKIERFCKHVLDGMMLIQDFYGMARLLSTISPPTRAVTTPRNIIVYVGHNHLKFYKDALRLVGFERKHRVRDKKSFQCLDISGINFLGKS